MGTMVPTVTTWQVGGGVASAITESRPSGEISLQKNNLRLLLQEAELPSGKKPPVENLFL